MPRHIKLWKTKTQSKSLENNQVMHGSQEPTNACGFLSTEAKRKMQSVTEFARSIREKRHSYLREARLLAALEFKRTLSHEVLQRNLAWWSGPYLPHPNNNYNTKFHIPTPCPMRPWWYSLKNTLLRHQAMHKTASVNPCPGHLRPPETGLESDGETRMAWERKE